VFGEKFEFCHVHFRHDIHAYVYSLTLIDIHAYIIYIIIIITLLKDINICIIVSCGLWTIILKVMLMARGTKIEATSKNTISETKTEHFLRDTSWSQDIDYDIVVKMRRTG